MIMSLKHIVHKASRSVAKHIRRFPRSFDLKRGKASALNPISSTYHVLRKVGHGMRGSVMSKVRRYLGRRSAKGVPYQFTVAGSSGSGYVHDAKSLSQLTGGR